MEPRLGVTGEDAPAVAERATGAGLDASVVDPSAPGDRDAVVAVGQAALVDLARARVDVPVLPVACGRGVGSVPPSALGDALETLRDGEAPTRSLPLLAADGAPPALFDVSLMAARPASISEFSVSTGADGGRRVARFRSDGVVVATPAGSHGYARDARGAVLGPGVDALSAVPVAPYTVDPEWWVLSEPVVLGVERDEGEVVLLVDGREERAVPPHDPLRVDVEGSLETFDLPVGEPPFGRMEKT